MLELGSLQQLPSVTALSLISPPYFVQDLISKSFSQLFILIATVHVDNGMMILLEYSLGRQLDICRQSPLFDFSYHIQLE